MVQRICEISPRLLGVSGASICLVGGARHQVVVHATDPLGEHLVNLQTELGQGPCFQAVWTGSPIFVPNLRRHRPSAWHAYAEQALARGVRATFTFPLQAGTTRLGALDLHRLEAGPLTARQTADAFLLCGLTNRSILTRNDGASGGVGVGAEHRLARMRREYRCGRTSVLDLGVTLQQALPSPWGSGNTSSARRPPAGPTDSSRLAHH